MNNFGAILIAIGLLIIISINNPDTSFGLGAGVGILLIGLCIITTKDNV